MSVLIKGVKMPKSCDECFLAVRAFNYVRNEYVSICQLENSIGCPLVEVPTPHGRLIDADKMDSYMLPTEKQDRKSYFVHSAEYKNAVPHFNHALRLVRDNVPTVIESEE